MGQSEQLAAPRLSVVVACQVGPDRLLACLEGLARQRVDRLSQIVVVDSAGAVSRGEVQRRFPDAQLVERASAALVPELWSEGFRRARGTIVALLSAEMVPQPGWADALLDSYGSGRWVGVGGPIQPVRTLSRADWAIYWLRYSNLAAPRQDQEVSDIAGDNGSYQASALAPFAQQIEGEGFWEYELNRRLRERGGQLFFASRALVLYQGGESLRQFTLQRLAHGRRFGCQRIAGRPALMRCAFILAWPLTPLVLLARIWRNARRAGKSASFLRSLPLLLLPLSGWSCGELFGYLFGERAQAGDAVDRHPRS